MSSLMNPDVKTAWLFSLRSGKYKQARARLKSAWNAYCCLGVLVLSQDPKINWDSTDGFGDEPLIHDQTRSPLNARSYAPMDFAAGLDGDDQRHLAYLNDQKGYSFEQIADYVEANH